MRKILLALVLVMSMAFVPILTVGAEGTAREVSVYLYRDYTDCVFFVGWENAEQTATVQIKSPDGKVTDATAKNSVIASGKVTVNMGKAKSGYWTVYVTGESLGTINISGGNKNEAAAQYNAIQSFTADVDNGYIKFKWKVKSELDKINVSITANQGNDYSNRSLWNDYSADKSGSASVSADELQTGLYSFSIQAYDGNSQYTLTTEKPVYVKQSNAPAKLENIRVGSIDGELFAAWDNQLNSSYTVTLYDSETLSVLKTDYAHTNYYPITLPDGVNKAKFSVAVNDGNAYGEFDVFEIANSTPTGAVTFPDYSSTRESTVKVNVDCLDNVTAGVYLDGTLLIENASAGDYDLTLSEGTHEIVAYIKDVNGNMKTFTKSITVDKTPPAVNLNASDKLKTANKSFVLEGNTEPNAVVSINGVEQELGAGSFMAKLALANGVNPVTVAAYDTAGNKSVKTINAERTSSGIGNLTVFILPGIVFILLIVWYARLNKKSKGEQSE